MVTVINTEELRRNGTTPVFEGYRHGDVPVSFFLSDASPGGGPRRTPGVVAATYKCEPARISVRLAAPLQSEARRAVRNEVFRGRRP